MNDIMFDIALIVFGASLLVLGMIFIVFFAHWACSVYDNWKWEKILAGRGIDFPREPKAGEFYLADNGLWWQYDGRVWKILRA